MRMYRSFEGGIGGGCEWGIWGRSFGDRLEGMGWARELLRVGSDGKECASLGTEVIRETSLFLLCRSKASKVGGRGCWNVVKRTDANGISRRILRISSISTRPWFDDTLLYILVAVGQADLLPFQSDETDTTVQHATLASTALHSRAKYAQPNTPSGNSRGFFPPRSQRNGSPARRRPRRRRRFD